MKVKFIINKRESEFIKKQLSDNVTKVLGPKATYENGIYEVEETDQSKIIELMKQSGMKYEKAS